MTNDILHPAGKKVRFITLGCKVNTYETQGMREALERSGIEECRLPDEGCDYVVINTCTVTQDADRENRYWIRRARRENAKAKIIVTGCYTERDRQVIEALPGVDMVLTNRDKADLVEHVLGNKNGVNAETAEESVPPAGESKANLLPAYPPITISRFEGHGRAYVKIQEGCNHACSFCKVVLVRGRSRSRAFHEILDEILRLRDSGYREIVFTGIQLGAYGLDSGKPAGLVELLEAASEVEGIERLRLSSIELKDIHPVLIQTLRDIPKCCPHLHIPLQSGDDEILKRMNRRYGRTFYLSQAVELKSLIPDFSLTLDVMAGFPGEEEFHFQNTVDLLEALRPLKCHVFPYSRREGTPAARLSPCATEVIRVRVRKLLELNERLGYEVRRQYLGRVFPVLIEKKVLYNGFLQGLTPNYLKVSFPGQESWLGEIVAVKLSRLEGDTFSGDAVALQP